MCAREYAPSENELFKEFDALATLLAAIEISEAGERVITALPKS